MKIEDAVVLITGANRGIGLALANAALAAGARKVYAGMRNPTSMPGVESVRLDVTDADQVARAARDCGDVTLLINNAGIGQPGGFLSDPDSEAAILRHLQVNVFGMLSMCRAFAPVLGKNGGGAVLNVLSVASWVNSPQLGPYGLSKSAAWALTNGLRTELRPQGTLVSALHMGFVDTDLVRGFDVPKMTAQDVAAQALAGVAAGAEEVLAGTRAQEFKRGLTAEPPVYLGF